jgi:hypothetical protein
VVQQDDKDDDSDDDWEPPVIFAREVDTRAVDFDNGDGSIIDLDCCDGKNAATVTIVAQRMLVLISNFI